MHMPRTSYLDTYTTAYSFFEQISYDFRSSYTLQRKSLELCKFVSNNAELFVNVHLVLKVLVFGMVTE